MALEVKGKGVQAVAVFFQEERVITITRMLESLFKAVQPVETRVLETMEVLVAVVDMSPLLGIMAEAVVDILVAVARVVQVIMNEVVAVDPTIQETTSLIRPHQEMIMDMCVFFGRRGSTPADPKSSCSTHLFQAVNILCSKSSETAIAMPPPRRSKRRARPLPPVE